MRARKILGAALFAALLGLTASASAIAARNYGTDIVRNQSELQVCAGATRGSVVINLEISPDGHLTSGRVVESSSSAMRHVGECVLQKARRWRYQRSTSGGGGSYEIVPTDDAVQVRASRRR